MALTVICACIWFLPIYWALVTSFRTDDEAIKSFSRCREATRHGRFRIGAPGAGDDLPFCGQHKTNTTPGSGKDQHGNNTDKTVLPGTRRHAC